MKQIIDLLLRRFDTWRYRRNVKCALALHLRGEVRRDGLKAEALCHRLELRWRARDIHPWDRQRVSALERAPLFWEQTLVDTEAAIFRLFETLPVLDVLYLTVVDHTSENVIVSGTVDRSMLNQGRNLLSVRMRLCELGVTQFTNAAAAAKTRLTNRVETLV